MGYRFRQRLSGALLRLLARGAQRFSQSLALRLRSEAVRIAPDSWRNYLARGEQLYFELTRYAEALEDAEAGLSLTKESPALYELRAMIFLSQGEHERALADFDRLKLRWPGRPDLSFLRALCLKSLGRKGGALEEFENDLKTSPLHLESLQGKAQCLYNIGRNEEALKTADFGLEHYPGDAELLEAAVQARLALDRAGEALLFANRLVAAAGDSAFARHLRANALEEEGQLERALKDRQQSVKLDPAAAAYWNRLAVLYGRLGKPRAAAKCLRKAVRLDPGSVTLRLNLGLSLEDTGDLLGALGEFDAAVRLDNKNPDHYYYRGRALFAMDRPDEGERDLTLAIKMTNVDPHYFYLRGKIYEQKKELAKALADYTRAIELDPKCGPAYERRGAVYFDLGDKEKAREDSKAARDLMYGG